MQDQDSKSGSLGFRGVRFLAGAACVLRRALQFVVLNYTEKSSGACKSTARFGPKAIAP